MLHYNICRTDMNICRSTDPSLHQDDSNVNKDQEVRILDSAPKETVELFTTHTALFCCKFLFTCCFWAFPHCFKVHHTNMRMSEATSPCHRLLLSDPLQTHKILQTEV